MLSIIYTYIIYICILIYIYIYRFILYCSGQRSSIFYICLIWRVCIHSWSFFFVSAEPLHQKERWAATFMLLLENQFSAMENWFMSSTSKILVARRHSSSSFGFLAAWCSRMFLKNKSNILLAINKRIHNPMGVFVKFVKSDFFNCEKEQGCYTCTSWTVSLLPEL